MMIIFRSNRSIKLQILVSEWISTNGAEREREKWRTVFCFIWQDGQYFFIELCSERNYQIQNLLRYCLEIFLREWPEESRFLPIDHKAYFADVCDFLRCGHIICDKETEQTRHSQWTHQLAPEESAHHDSEYILRELRCESPSSYPSPRCNRCTNHFSLSMPPNRCCRMVIFPWWRRISSLQEQSFPIFLHWVCVLLVTWLFFDKIETETSFDIWRLFDIFLKILQLDWPSEFRCKFSSNLISHFLFNLMCRKPTLTSCHVDFLCDFVIFDEFWIELWCKKQEYLWYFYFDIIHIMQQKDYIFALVEREEFCWVRLAFWTPPRTSHNLDCWLRNLKSIRDPGCSDHIARFVSEGLKLLFLLRS